MLLTILFIVLKKNSVMMNDDYTYYRQELLEYI